MYKASMDLLTKWLTFGVGTLLIFTGFLPYFTSNDFPIFQYFIPFAFILLLAITYGYSPKGYSIQDGQLVILRPFKAKNYSLEDIQSVTSVDRDNLKGSLRIFGVGGLFGYYGLFRNSTYGNMIWYATRRDQFVVIERSNGKTIVITPDDPESFVSAYQMFTRK